MNDRSFFSKTCFVINLQLTLRGTTISVTVCSLAFLEGLGTGETLSAERLFGLCAFLASSYSAKESGCSFCESKLLLIVD